MKDATIKELLGKMMTSVEINDARDAIGFTCNDGTRYMLYHDQDCCESVRVEDVCGELSDLVGASILQADEETSNVHPVNYKPDGCDDSFTWTFYRFATFKGSVVVRWLGESNGYYSESVSFGRCERS